MLESLTPGQKQMLMAGVPVVAVFAFLASRKKAAAPAAAASAPVAMPTNAVLGADALNSFMDQISQSIGGLQSQIDGMGAADITTPPAPAAPPPTPTAAPSTTDNTATPPTAVDQYHVGQMVNPASGESIVAAGYSPAYGWVNLTSKGGIYTGGGGAGQQIPGSYLGYAASLPQDQQAAELALHGTFGSGGLAIDPTTGGYVETNTKGETYKFGTAS